MKKIPILLTIVAMTVCMADLSAQDWPQYMGPDRNGISNYKGIMRTWPAEGPAVQWTTNVGIGFGGPIVKDGKVYLLDRNDETGDIFRCFDLNTGEELWQYAYSSPGSVMFPGSRSVPVADGNYVYSCGPYGDLYCFDINTHKPVWNKNVWKDFGGEEVPTWAISQCPLVYGDLLIIASQAPQAGVVAYNKLTGAVAWKTESIGAAGYVSPNIIKIDGTDHVVMVSASNQRAGQMGNVVGIEPLTGKIVWQYSNWNCHIPVPCAVDAGDNKILITGGYELGATMIQVTKNAGGSYETKELFSHNDFGDQTKTPILFNNHFYGQFGTNSTRDGLCCMDMNGNVLWKTKRAPDFNKGSMIIVDNLLIATDGTKTLYLIEPNPSGFKPISQVEILGEGKPADPNDMASRVGGATQNWAPLAFSNGMLLIRDQGKMMCVKLI